LEALATQLFSKGVDIDSLFVETGDDVELLQINTELDLDEETEKIIKQHLSSKNLENYGISWQNQNHSVLLVGWGVDEEKGTKYWIVRNSYDSWWGQNGDFLIRRGQNDFGIEADVVAFEPALCDSSSPETCKVL